ncbi:myosin-6 [Dorcoceras hygrometricum]|uniref:Myosin-6 n=1 Tax=Dorcoceras hygrometricum TaxID=472368 RepID=A0A2Z7BIW3_9LAMI|nr:myosin-6 [Dorcoceras hygrometricum]
MLKNLKRYLMTPITTSDPRIEQLTSSPTYASKIGDWPDDSLCARTFARGLVLSSRVFLEDIVMTRRVLPTYVFPYLKNPGTIRLSLFRQEDPDDRGEYSSRYSLPPSLPLYKYQHVENGIHENVDALFTSISENLGFSEGKPVAAFTIYKCLIHWKSFEAERTSVFDRLIQYLGSAMEAFRSSPSANLSIGGLDGVSQVEAKYPALLFKQQLTAYVEKIYGIIRDNTKKEMSSIISLCIQASRTSRGNSFDLLIDHVNGSSRISHWQSVTESLNSLLSTPKENYPFSPPGALLVYQWGIYKKQAWLSLNFGNIQYEDTNERSLTKLIATPSCWISIPFSVDDSSNCLSEIQISEA